MGHVEHIQALTPEQEADLIRRFLSRDHVGEVALLDALQPVFRAEIRRHFPSFWRDAKDLMQTAIVKLLELRERGDPEHRIQAPLSELARYLIDAPARVVRRARKNFVPIEDYDFPTRSTQVGSVELKERLERAAELPRGMAQTLLLHAAHEMGDGPPLHESLGIDERSAKRRLHRAQQALWQLTNPDGDSDELSQNYVAEQQDDEPDEEY